MHYIYIILSLVVPFAAYAADKASSSIDWLSFIPMALLGISEVLSMIPAVKSNGIFQLIFNFLKKLKK